MDPATLPAVLHNPALLDREACAASAQWRPALFARLVASLQEADERAAPQHALILGPPGAGKSHLLRVLGHHIETAPALRARWFPITFPEVQYGLAREADLWTCALDYLVVALDRRNQRAKADGIRASVAGLPVHDEGQRAEAALGILRAAADALECRFVLLVDQLDRVLEHLERDHWRVRELLSTEPRLMVIGTSTQAIAATYRYDAAFYDFFRIHALNPLQPEVAQAALGSAAQIGADAARQAVLTLAGRQPRAVAALVDIAARSGADPITSDAARLLFAVLDRLTPSYQPRIDNLPSQAQHVVHALAAAWHPARAADVARVVRLPTNLVSAQLTRLCRDGLVERVALPGSARMGYQLADRPLAVWFLMRAGQPHRRRVAVAARFVQAALTPNAPLPPGEFNALAEAIAAEDAAGAAARVGAVAPELRDALRRASQRLSGPL